MNLSPFGHRRLDSGTREEVVKAVAIAGLCAVVTKSVELAGDEVKAWLAKRRERATGAK